MRKRRARASSQLRAQIEIPNPPPLFGEMPILKALALGEDCTAAARKSRNLRAGYVLSPFFIDREFAIEFGVHGHMGELSGEYNSELLSFEPIWVPGDLKRDMFAPPQPMETISTRKDSAERPPAITRSGKRQRESRDVGPLTESDASSLVKIEGSSPPPAAPRPSRPRKRASVQSRHSSRAADESSSRIGEKRSRSPTHENPSISPPSSGLSRGAEAEADANEEFEHLYEKEYREEDYGSDAEVDEGDYTVNHYSSDEDGDNW